MKTKLEINDGVTLITQNDGKCRGTIISIDNIGYIMQTGPDYGDLEVIEKRSLIGMQYDDDFYQLQYSHEQDLFGPRVPCPQPALGSVPPRWDVGPMKWFHAGAGFCKCGCGVGTSAGTLSASPEYLI
ncbi:MAG: hypothetical protein RSB25_19680 [Acinetobacter sp.]